MEDSVNHVVSNLVQSQPLGDPLLPTDRAVRVPGGQIRITVPATVGSRFGHVGHETVV
jgi:hypothetical protein